jgi:serine/threonine-protein kinase
VPIDPITINSNLPAGLSKIVLKSLAKSPGDRFQTARQFLEALGSLRTGETTTLPIVVYPDRVSSRRPDYAETTLALNKPEKPAFDADVLDAVTRDLANYVGPIAKIIVSRASKQALTLDNLYSFVAAEISTEDKRNAFLAARLKYSASK